MLLDIIVPAVLFAVSMLSLWWLIRITRKNDRIDASVALIRTLDLANREGLLSDQQCLSFFHIWDHYLNVKSDKGVACACKAVKLHCKDDACVRDDIEHTTKFCDVVETRDA